MGLLATMQRLSMSPFIGMIGTLASVCSTTAFAEDIELDLAASKALSWWFPAPVFNHAALLSAGATVSRATTSPQRRWRKCSWRSCRPAGQGSTGEGLLAEAALLLYHHNGIQTSGGHPTPKGNQVKSKELKRLEAKVRNLRFELDWHRRQTYDAQASTKPAKQWALEHTHKTKLIQKGLEHAEQALQTYHENQKQAYAWQQP